MGTIQGTYVEVLGTTFGYVDESKPGVDKGSGQVLDIGSCESERHGNLQDGGKELEDSAL